MPELPEVETVRAGLQRAVAGKTIAEVRLRRGDLRLPFPPHFADTLEGRKITRVDRRAKYLLIHLSGGQVWLAHLGMSGRFSVHVEMPEILHTHDHVVVIFTDGSALIYRDARRFGVMDVVKARLAFNHKLLKNLGFEPLVEDFPLAGFTAVLQSRSLSIKQALMDASLIVGVGNIYASEALFAARIDPRKPASSVAKQAKKILKSVQDVLRDAIASGGSSLRDFVEIGGQAGYFQHCFRVYGREGKPCFRCGTPIRKITQGGRSTFFCGVCQR